MKKITSIDVTEIRQCINSSWIVVVRFDDGDYDCHAPIDEQAVNNLIASLQFNADDVKVKRFQMTRKGAQAFIVAPDVESPESISIW